MSEMSNDHRPIHEALMKDFISTIPERQAFYVLIH